MKLSVFISLACILCSAEALKVLVLFPFAVKSLSILGTGVVRHLLNAGHEVILYSIRPTAVQRLYLFKTSCNI